MEPHQQGPASDGAGGVDEFDLRLDWGERRRSPRPAVLRRAEPDPAPRADAPASRGRTAQVLALVQDLADDIGRLEAAVAALERRIASMERTVAASVAGREEQVEPAVGRRATRKLRGRIW